MTLFFSNFDTSNSMLRAERALLCSPFSLELFITMKKQSVSFSTIIDTRIKNKRYTLKFLSEQQIDQRLTWLIKVGILRREVDGQGITDGFRLTPLGKKIVEKWQNKRTDIHKLSLLDRVSDSFLYYLNSLI
ncbi:MAG: hypothetical protein JXR06_03480 [Candidatus Atelocyanobacterium thalassa]